MAFLQYLDDTNHQGAINVCERITGLGHQGISGDSNLKAQFTVLLNDALLEFHSIVQQARDGVDFQDANATNTYPIYTRALTTNRDYKFSTASWSPIGEEGGAAGGTQAITPKKIKRVDVCYDGVSNTCYRAAPIDSTEITHGLGNDTDTDADFTVYNPRYDLKSDALWLYPIASSDNVANGGIIRIEIGEDIDLFTTSDTTQQIGFDENFHMFVPKHASLNWLAENIPENTQLISTLQKDLQKIEMRASEYYGNQNEDGVISITPYVGNYE